MYRTIIVYLLMNFACSLNLHAQKKGCTDPQASNYDASAKENDGSCSYSTTSYSPKTVCAKLSDTLAETSGLIYFNNWFWTLNDSGNEPAIYAFDSTKGTLIHSVYISNKPNIDWEEITQDDSNIYIGDFGNNAGDRTDLKIYILKKNDLTLNLTSEIIVVDEILFSYADQSSFVSSNQNTNFDMEAMCVIGDSIHLFSKNWVDKRTRHYIMPAVAGTYILTPRESISVDGLITSACSNAAGDKIILGGYNTSNGACFMWMLWDFKDNLAFNGNKRKIDLGNALTLGQYEGTSFKKDQLYFTNEKKFTNQRLWRAEINQWFTTGNASIPNSVNKGLNFIVYQKDNELIVESKNNTGLIIVSNSSGQKLIEQKIKSERTTIPITTFSSGIYTVSVNGTIQKIVISR